MGSITKYQKSSGKVGYRAYICIKGVKENKCFDKRSYASRWIADREVELRANPYETIRGKTTTDLIERYLEEVAPGKGAAAFELQQGRRFLKGSLAGIPLGKLSAKHLQNYIAKEQARGLKNSSINRMAAFFRAIVKQGVKWRWVERMPFDAMDVPQLRESPGRDLLYNPLEIYMMRITLGVPPEDEDLDGWVADDLTTQTGVLFLIALETGCRLGELVKTNAQHLDLAKGLHHIPAENCKTNKARTVPLSDKAVQLWRCLEELGDGSMIPYKATSVTQRFAKSRRKARLRRDITFHDARHYATTQLAKKFDPMSLMKITGHSDFKMVMRYFNPSMEDLRVTLVGNDK